MVSWMEISLVMEQKLTSYKKTYNKREMDISKESLIQYWDLINLTLRNPELRELVLVEIFVILS